MSSPIFEFPLIRLPRVPLDVVIGEWNPRELYNFSILSKKTKKISKSLKKKPSKIDFTFSYHRYLSISFSERTSDKWYFSTSEISEFSEIPVGLPNFISIFSDNPTEKFFEISEHLQEIYNSEFYKIYFIFHEIQNFENLNFFMDWINNNSMILKFPKIWISTENRFLLEFFLESFTKNIGNLEIHKIENSSENAENIYLKFPKHLKIDELISISESKWCQIDSLLTMNFENIYLEKTQITNKNLNEFLKNWMDGTSNSRIRNCELEISKKLNWKIITRGLSTEIMDPRTTKRIYVNDYNQDIRYIHGGIDIKRKTDGKIGTIQLLCHSSEDENETIPLRIISEYENALNWNQQNYDIEDDDYVVRYTPRRFFIFTVW